MTTAYITDTRFAGHTLKGHAEYAGRLIAIQSVLDNHAIPARTIQLTPTPASDAQLKVVHSQDYLDLLAWTETQKGLQLGPDTYVLPQSFGIAKLSAGAAIRGVDAVLTE